YYQGFNSSIGTFGGVMQNIGGKFNERVKEMKSQLKTCKETLMSKRSDLLQLWFRSQQYKEMIRILDQIEEFKETPEKLEVLLMEKHFLTAAKMLLDAIKTLEKKEMIGIGALSDLRRYLKAQQSSLHELLIEELHNHLYLKNSYCDSRWVKYTKDQKTLPSPLMEWQSGKETRKISYMTLKNKKNLQVNTGFTMSTPLSPKSPKPLNNNITFNDEDEMIVENLEINPETDSFYYLEILIESLSTLKKLPQALETITQRIPIELYQLVDKTIAEVEERNSEIFSQKSKINDVADIFALDYPENDAQMEILRDLLWTLYSKLDAVLQGHRFILDIVEKISKRQEYQKSDSQNIKVYSFIEIWKPVQSEVRTLLRDYITEDERESISENTSEASIQEMIKDRRARDASKQLFRFGDSDTTLNEELNKQYKRDISTVLQNSMPEVFAKVPDERQLSAFIVDRFANANITAGHKLVIKPDAFNVSIIFKPTLAFLDKVKKIIPSSAHQSSADFTTFLDDFVFNVFLPQIGDKIFEIFRQSTAESDAFQEDPNYKTYSALPVIKSASSLMMIVESLCAMLHNMASHKEEYSKMIISLLTQYYVKCFEQYQATVSKNKGEANVKDDANNQGISATWVQQDQLSEVLGQYPYVAEDNAKNRRKRRQLCDKETRIEMNFKKNREISLGQLITDNKKLTALANLYHSLKWFVAKIWELRGKDSTGNLHSTKMDDGNLAKINRRWSSYGDVNFSLNVDDEKKKENGDREISLPLTGEMANRFDALLATFQQLAEQNLFTLRIELRCHTLHYLDKAMREGNYQLEYEAYEPDPYVLTLNADMVKFNENIASHLPTKEHKFVFEGLDALMEHLLVNNAVFIRNLNTNGVMKMTRNILALQQNLKNIVETPGEISLERARRYYEMFNMGPVNMLTQIKEQGAIFSFEEYKIMLEIMYKIDPTDMQTTPSTRRDSPSSNRRLYNENLLELNELMLDFL
ncbi:8122_t:CDS:10, partial [Funneliformis caledonium]